ncbi:hypothetical protein FHU12_2335 [Serratia marcescens]|uniref:Scaffold protein n=3 Tax=Serratia TaxID=613 RepID=A0AA46K599_SERMA|nr:hypothetical protein FHU12_2335 [Serratia marcescens]
MPAAWGRNITTGLMMKFKITKDEYNALNDVQKALYKESGDGYQVQIEGMPDTSELDGLKKKVDELMTEKKTEQAARRKAEEDAKKAAEEQAKKNGDVEALEKSWAQKLADAEAKSKAEIASLNTSLHGLLVDNVAQKLATELAGDAAPVMLPHIKSRLAIEEKDGQHVTRILDGAGKPSAASIDELKKEFVGNAAFKGVIIGSKASGTGGNGGGNPGAGGGGNGNGDNPDSLVSRARQIIENNQE